MADIQVQQIEIGPTNIAIALRPTDRYERPDVKPIVRHCAERELREERQATEKAYDLAGTSANSPALATVSPLMLGDPSRGQPPADGVSERDHAVRRFPPRSRSS
jgi:hypothetical protein